MAKKLYYKIGEVCKLLDVKPFVLRYWETEFPFLNPSKSKSGQRIYSERDIGVIRRVHELLNVEGYTIAGARKKLQAEVESGASPGSSGAKPKATAGALSKQSPALDTEARLRIEKLRSGIEEALREARGILEVLGSGVTKTGVTKSSDSAA